MNEFWSIPVGRVIRAQFAMVVDKTTDGDRSGSYKIQASATSQAGACPCCCGDAMRGCGCSFLPRHPLIPLNRLQRTSLITAQEPKVSNSPLTFENSLDNQQQHVQYLAERVYEHENMTTKTSSDVAGRLAVWDRIALVGLFPLLGNE